MLALERHMAQHARVCVRVSLIFPGVQSALASYRTQRGEVASLHSQTFPAPALVVVEISVG